jgi:hypothetical protein
MPIAWVVTLAVCAGSAFAVRDVVFPSLSPSAAPSLWQPKPSDTTVAGNGTTVPDRIDVGAGTVSVVVVTVPPVGSDSSVPETSTVADGSAGGLARPARQTNGSTSVTTVASSPGTTAPGGDDHTGTTVPKTTNTTAHSTTSVSQTTNPDTGDTLPDDSGGGGSGSGRGGNGNDTLP